MSHARAEPAAALQPEHRSVLERAKSLDPQVWATWHDEYSGFIYRYAYTRLNSEDDARDIASQTFLEAMRSIHRYSDRGKPVLAWFYGIAHNLVSRRRRELAKMADVAVPETGPPATSEEDIILGLHVRSALEKLKVEQRDVLILRFAMGLPTKQVAAILGKTEAATYSLQVRGAASLKKFLATS